MVAQYAHIWYQGQLITCWAIQYVAALIYFIFAVIVLAGTNRSTLYNYDAGAKEYRNNSVIVAAFVLVFSVLTIALNITGCVLYTHRNLPPIFGLLSGLLKSVLWIAYLVLIPLTLGIGGVLPVDYVFDLLLVLSSLVQTGFGAMHTIQERRGVYVEYVKRKERKSSPKKTESA